MVDLRLEHERVMRQWRESLGAYSPLSVAAAIAFHETCRNEGQALSPEDYAGALDIAAAALCRLIPIYTRDALERPVPVPVDITRQRFCEGATKLRGADGAVLTPLTVARRDLQPAIRTIARARIEFGSWTP